MQPPTLELILQNREDAIKGIRVSAGYFTDVQEVTRFRAGPYTDLLPSVSLYALVEEAADPGQMPLEDRWLTLTAEGVLFVPDPTQLDTQLACFQADLYRAVMADPTCGGFAIDTHYLSVRKGPLGPGKALLQADFAVHYRFMREHPELAA